MKTILAANNGGHFAQLFRLSRRLLSDGDLAMWMTVPTAQTESLLVGCEVHWLHPAATRDLSAVVANRRSVSRFLNSRSSEFGRAVSTGSSVALSVLPVTSRLGISSYYVESATRTDAPSLTGRILEWTPRVHCFTQYQSNASMRWRFGGSVFDGFSVRPVPRRSVRRIVVSLGTSDTFPFSRLVESLLRSIPDGVEVFWQTGSTDVSHLPIEGHVQVSSSTLSRKIVDADVVIAHCGTGIALTALQAGRLPILVPRDPSRGEHVDDHQLQLGEQLSRQGLSMTLVPEELNWSVIQTAAGFEVLTGEDEPFRFD